LHTCQVFLAAGLLVLVFLEVVLLVLVFLAAELLTLLCAVPECKIKLRDIQSDYILGIDKRGNSHIVAH
jgi:hypothetical protein